MCWLWEGVLDYRVGSGVSSCGKETGSLRRSAATPSSEPPVRSHAPAEADGRARLPSSLWRHTAILGASLCVLYGFLWNGYWAPESDGAIYLSVARNLFLDHEYHFNGVLPVIIPPLWPILLAGLFHLSTSFWFLNLVSTLVMIASAMIWHRILLRLTRPGRAFGIAFLSAMILEWYRLGTLPYTDPLAVLVLGVAVLLALQMQEAGRGLWRIPLLFLLVCVAVLLRYAAMLGILLVAGALVRGERRPRLHVSWLTAALCLLGGMATLVWVRCAYA
jgi:hypothetical protein